MDHSELRIIIVAGNAHSKAGGEALLPLQYLRLLASRGEDVFLVTHERNRVDLTEAVPECLAQIRFTPPRRLSTFLERAGQRLPRNIKAMSTWLLMGLITGLDIRAVARDLVREAPGSAVVHEPVPVSPRQPSLMTNMSAPVVIGPLNGGMEYPRAFRKKVSATERLLRLGLRRVSGVANYLLAGKARASAVLVANDRTRQALPAAVSQDRVVQVVENAVDLALFQTTDHSASGPPRFVYLGRLVDWKRVDLLLQALAQTPQHFALDIIGPGPLRTELENLSAHLGTTDRVRFHGALAQDQCARVLADSVALVLPSIYESGGAVVLEAMASGIPVIATKWGGPLDYVEDEQTGILVPPDGPAELAAGLASAMVRLGSDTVLANKMGLAGRRRVETHFDWQRLIDQIQVVYRQVQT